MPIYEDILDRKLYLNVDDYVLGYNDRVGIYSNAGLFIQQYLNTENDHFYILVKTPFSTRAVSSVITQNVGKIFDYSIANLEIEDLPPEIVKRIQTKNFPNSRFINFLLVEIRFINDGCWSVDQKAKLIRLLIDLLFLTDWRICVNPEFLEGYEIDTLIGSICEHGLLKEKYLDSFIHRDMGEYIIGARKKGINYRGLTPNFMPRFINQLPTYLYGNLDNMIYVLHSIDDTKSALDRASDNLDSSTEIVDCLIDQFKIIRRNF